MSTLLCSPARCATDAAVLDAIRDPGCNLAVWQRSAFADFSPIMGDAAHDLRFVSDLHRFPETFRRALIEGGYGGTEALRRVLIADAGLLAERFCGAMDLAMFELRLEIVRTDSCRKFHADYVSARLITTYVGAGTDWLDADDAARVAAGQEPRQINRLGAFDVGLFKGRLATDRPAIHRSPPIAGTGAARLLMVLNPVSKSSVDGSVSPLLPGGHLT